MPAQADRLFPPSLARSTARKGPDGVRQEAADHLAQICALLRARTGHDFSGYKDRPSCAGRSGACRCCRSTSVPDYIERAAQGAARGRRPVPDLLIGVTNFFRDPEAFEALERRSSRSCSRARAPDDTVRVWVPGCATGEEAYSIAILLREHMRRPRAPPRLQIFATDIDEQRSRSPAPGVYPAASPTDVSPRAAASAISSREDGDYAIAKEIREICVFSAHNLIRDPPFSRST